MLLRGVFLLLLAAQCVLGWRPFQNRIPNGDHVPHPCKTNYVWWGVGHMSPLGGGERNPFGEDFERLNKQWSEELCRLDSDKDGWTNGEELGDPDCTWTVGTFPKFTKNISHPGVCDPWGSPQCEKMNEDITCDTGEFVCDAVNETDVFNITLRFPSTPVPAEETTYICQTFELDMLEPGVDYHMVASQPYIDNPDVMHHTLVYGCDATSSPVDEPVQCNMAQEGCNIPLAVWTLGIAGECVNKVAGFKVGRNVFTRLSIQHHWTNVEKRSDLVDSSGMTLYLTKKLRQHDAGFITKTALDLVIPPGKESVVHTYECSSRCTKKHVHEPIYLMTGMNHMHYLGYRQNVEHIRKKEKLRDLTPDENYSYDNPIIHQYEPPIEFLPGDVLKTTCEFRSLSRTTTTRYGLGTFDEMCSSLFSYYPAENVNMSIAGCAAWRELEFCDFDLTNFYGCNMAEFFSTTKPDPYGLFAKIYSKCHVVNCNEECIRAIDEVRHHPCFAGPMEDYMMFIFGENPSTEGLRFLNKYRSCSCSHSDNDDSYHPPHHPHRPSGANQLRAATGSILLSIILFLAL